MPEPADTPASLERSPRDFDRVYREFHEAWGEDTVRAKLRFAIAAVTVGGCAGIVAVGVLESLLDGIVVFLTYPILAKLLLRPVRAAVHFKVGTLSPYDAGEAAIAALLWPIGLTLFVPVALFVGLVRRVP